MTPMTQAAMTRRAFALAGLGAVLGTRVTYAQPATPVPPVSGGAALYRVDLPASSLLPAPFAVGAAGVTMAAGTTVEYAEGAAGRSVAIDHVLAGEYEIEAGSELIHIDTAGNITSIDAGETTTVATGETIVLLRNEAGQRITAGEEETRTLTVGFFSLQQQGTGETTVEGTLDQAVLGGMILQEVPESGVTVIVVPSGDADEFMSSVAEVPVVLKDGAEWTVLVLPLTSEATPVA